MAKKITTFNEKVLDKSDIARKQLIVDSLSNIITDGMVYTILDLGCHQGHIIKCISEKYLNIAFTGVDKIDYSQQLQFAFDFIHDDVINYILNSEDRFDIVLCNWIICHLKIETAYFWGRLVNLSNYLLILDNDTLLNYDLRTTLEAVGSELIKEIDYHDVHDYKLRIFKNSMSLDDTWM